MDMVTWRGLFPPTPEPLPTAVPLGEQKRLEVFHSFDDDDEPGDAWRMVAMVAVRQDEAPFDADDRKRLMQAAKLLDERYGEGISENSSDYSDYAYSSVKLARGWVFVYLTLLFWPDAETLPRN